MDDHRDAHVEVEEQRFDRVLEEAGRLTGELGADDLLSAPRRLG